MLLMMNNDDDEEEVREEDGREAYEFVFYAIDAREKHYCVENRR